MPTTDFSRTPARLEACTVERPGCSLRIWSGGGTGPAAVMLPAVVMLHGATADHRLFNPQVGPLLDAGYRVVVIDARGHGQSRPARGRADMASYAGDLYAVLDQLGIERAVLVGQSLGAYIAQHAVVRDPERFAGLAVVGSTPISVPLSRPDALALRSTIQLFKAWPWAHLRRVTVQGTAQTPEARNYMAECLAGLTKAEFLTIWRAVNTAVSREGFPDLPPGFPVLWTHGENDRTGNIRRDALRLARAGGPGFEHAVIPGASHNANQDNPEFFNLLLLRFLKELQ